MKETLSRQECWDYLLSQHNNDVSKTALAMLEVLTGGASDLWDDEKHESFTSALIKRYNKVKDKGQG